MNPINALMDADGQRPQLLKLDFFRPHPIIVDSNGRYVSNLDRTIFVFLILILNEIMFNF